MHENNDCDLIFPTLWRGTKRFSPGQTEGANQPEQERDFFFFFKQCSSSRSRLSFHAAQQTASRFPFPPSVGKALWSAVKCDVALGRGKHGGMGLRSMWRSHPHGHFVFTHRRPRRGELLPPAPREHSTGCLPVNSQKPTSSLEHVAVGTRFPQLPRGPPSSVLPSLGEPGGRGLTPSCSTGRLLIRALS